MHLPPLRKIQLLVTMTALTGAVGTTLLLGDSSEPAAPQRALSYSASTPAAPERDLTAPRLQATTEESAIPSKAAPVPQEGPEHKLVEEHGNQPPSSPAPAAPPAETEHLPLPVPSSALPATPEALGKAVLVRTGEWRVEEMTAQTLHELGEAYSPECPVAPRDLRKLTLLHYDFSGAQKQGTMVVHAEVAPQVVEIFQELHRERFPVHRMDHRPPAAEADPKEYSTTMGFVCRKKRGSGNWSEHSYGKAVDINPYENPMVTSKGRMIAGGREHLHRTGETKGLMTESSHPVQAFKERGWHWGGEWEQSKDYMHFSLSGE